MKKSGESQETSCRNYSAPGSMRGKRKTLRTWLLPLIIDFPVNHFQTRFTFVHWRNTVSKAIKSIHGVQPPGLPWVLCSHALCLYITSTSLAINVSTLPLQKHCLSWTWMFGFPRFKNDKYTLCTAFLTYASKHCLARFAVTRNTTKTDIDCVYRVQPLTFLERKLYIMFKIFNSLIFRTWKYTPGYTQCSGF